ncbi:hypothetical protein [Cupriavidus necator]
MTLTNASEMIARYKGDLFDKPHRDLKQRLLDAVLDQEIERYDDFLALLAEHGQVRMRNAGSADAYPNLKLADALKGINLKDHVFSREFVALPTPEKLAKLAADTAPQYEAAGAVRPPRSTRLRISFTGTTSAPAKPSISTAATPSPTSATSRPHRRTNCSPSRRSSGTSIANL